MRGRDSDVIVTVQLNPASPSPDAQFTNIHEGKTLFPLTTETRLANPFFGMLPTRSLSVRNSMVRSATGVGRRQLNPIRVTRRFQSTNAGGAGTNPLAAGAAGGAIVLLGVYGWYQFSGLKTIVKTSKTLEDGLAEVKKTLAEKTPTPDEALNYFRGVVKSYGTMIPGAAAYIDPFFDSVDELKKTHGEETEKIIKGTYDEIKETVTKGGFDVKTGQKVVDILKRRAAEVEELGKNVGADFIKPVLDKNPQLKEAVGGSYDELKDLAAKHGPEAKAKYDDLVKQLKEIFNKGVSADSIKQAQNLVQQKLQEVKELGEKAGKDAWEKAAKQAKPYLDKMPDVKKSLDENMKALLGSGSQNIQELYDKVKEVADKGANKQNIQELQELIKKKAKEASEKTGVKWDDAWKTLQKYIKKVPGGKEALDQAPQLQEFVEIIQQKGDDAQQLAEDTYNDIKKVLEKRLDEAKKLSQKK